MSRNLAASIRARLKQRADATKQDFNLTLTHYGLERLLYSIRPATYSGRTGESWCGGYGLRPTQAERGNPPNTRSCAQTP